MSVFKVTAFIPDKFLPELFSELPPVMLFHLFGKMGLTAGRIIGIPLRLLLSAWISDIVQQGCLCIGFLIFPLRWGDTATAWRAAGHFRYCMVFHCVTGSRCIVLLLIIQLSFNYFIVVFVLSSAATNILLANRRAFCWAHTQGRELLHIPEGCHLPQ